MTNPSVSTSPAWRATRGLAALMILGAIVSGCNRHETKNTDPMSTAEKNPEPPTKASSQPASGVVEAPFVAVIPEGSTQKPTTGAESSGSKGTGPSNGSTAIGGKTQ